MGYALSRMQTRALTCPSHEQGQLAGPCLIVKNGNRNDQFMFSIINQTFYEFKQMPIINSSNTKAVSSKTHSIYSLEIIAGLDELVEYHNYSYLLDQMRSWRFCVIQ